MVTEEQIDQLAKPDIPLRVSILRSLSDGSPQDVQLLMKRWPLIPLERRRRIVTRLAQIAEDDVNVDFHPLLRAFLRDSEPEVRFLAIEGLWEDKTPSLADQLVAVLASDPSTKVRAAAAQRLGAFAELASLGKLRGNRTETVRSALLGTLQDPDVQPEVWCRALESAAYWDDTMVAAAITQASASEDPLLQAAAVCAMGVSLNPAWNKNVRLALANSNPLVRLEATRAAGNMELREAASDLVELTGDPDKDVRVAAIEALGAAGGPIAKRRLQELTKSGDDATRKAAEVALDLLTFAAAPLELPPGGLEVRAKPRKRTPPM
jgi:HEAT repeat protein